MELVQHINGSWGRRIDNLGDGATVERVADGLLKIWLFRDIVARCKVADAKA
jgi:hypothetical protein